MLVLWQRGYLKKLMRMVIHQEPGFDNDGFGHRRVGENEEAYSTSERMVPTEANNNPRLDCKCFSCCCSSCSNVSFQMVLYL